MRLTGIVTALVITALMVVGVPVTPLVPVAQAATLSCSAAELLAIWDAEGYESVYYWAQVYCPQEFAIAQERYVYICQWQCGQNWYEWFREQLELAASAT